ncbi:DMT family transporter [Mesobacterium sp. TK19101]|uniref:DMT family transporter n=1 Tax=Mesobacterium hydrothermale TaxID=3111907 RepID=A0ABU6HHF1_9RHOB|nr:DMT family transporter [Mesobacterium sp. TK19101]MEC3861888.1 DMT family transporter [Mesobacterium sp. TK19101]
MSLWIAVSLAAALFQTVRFMLQKVLATVRLSATGATFSRFFYSAPLVILALFFYLHFSGRPMPAIGGIFWIAGMVGGIGQILATICVVALFKQRNFAVGLTFAKTEVIQSAMFGWLILGDAVSAYGSLAIVLGVAGVILLSRKPGDVATRWWRDLSSQASLLGLSSGVLFAISAVLYRAATLSVDSPDAPLRAAVTLAFVTGFQLCIMTIWLFWRDRDQLGRVWAARRTGIFVGLTSIGGSFGWFWAFTLQNAAYVKVVGQIELIFGILASVLFFHETITRREIVGIAILTGSILLLVLTI